MTTTTKIKEVEQWDTGNRTKVIWNPQKLNRFHKAFSKATKGKTDLLDVVFKFEGNEYCASYAAYLIDYLDGRFA